MDLQSNGSSVLSRLGIKARPSIKPVTLAVKSGTTSPPKLYIIGSLRNPKIPEIANRFRGLGWEVFDDWFAAGPEADDYWQKYETGRGHNVAQALSGHAAQNVFHFDKRHLDQCDAAMLVMPAGKSGHLELGYVIGSGMPGYILLDGEPERFDVMYAFADKVFTSLEEACQFLARS